MITGGKSGTLHAVPAAPLLAPFIFAVGDRVYCPAFPLSYMRDMRSLLVGVFLIAGIPAAAQSTGAINPMPGLEPGRATGRPCSTRIFRSESRAPELVNYLGLPISEGGPRVCAGARMRRASPCSEHQCQVHVAPVYLPGPAQSFVSGKRKIPQSQQSRRDQELHQHLRADADHLDGRAPAPFAECGQAYLDGFFHGELGRRHPDGQHHSHQAGLAPAQRIARERSGHSHRTLHPPRRHPHPCQHRDRILFI